MIWKCLHAAARTAAERWRRGSRSMREVQSCITSTIFWNAPIGANPACVCQFVRIYRHQQNDVFLFCSIYLQLQWQLPQQQSQDTMSRHQSLINLCLFRTVRIETTLLWVVLWYLIGSKFIDLDRLRQAQCEKVFVLCDRMQRQRSLTEITIRILFHKPLLLYLSTFCFYMAFFFTELRRYSIYS